MENLRTFNNRFIALIFAEVRNSFLPISAYARIFSVVNRCVKANSFVDRRYFAPMTSNSVFPISIVLINVVCRQAMASCSVIYYCFTDLKLLSLHDCCYLWLHPLVKINSRLEISVTNSNYEVEYLLISHKHTHNTYTINGFEYFSPRKFPSSRDAHSDGKATEK